METAADEYAAWGLHVRRLLTEHESQVKCGGGLAKAPRTLVALSGSDCRSSRGVWLGHAGVLPLEFSARLTAPFFAIVGTDDAVNQLEARDHRLLEARDHRLHCARPAR